PPAHCSARYVATRPGSPPKHPQSRGHRHDQQDDEDEEFVHPDFHGVPSTQGGFGAGKVARIGRPRPFTALLLTRVHDSFSFRTVHRTLALDRDAPKAQKPRARQASAQKRCPGFSRIRSLAWLVARREGALPSPGVWDAPAVTPHVTPVLCSG